MNEKNHSGLTKSDFMLLLQIPENELLGEIIKLNCTCYANKLDVIKVSTQIRKRRIKAA